MNCIIIIFILFSCVWTLRDSLPYEVALIFFTVKEMERSLAFTPTSNAEDSVIKYIYNNARNNNLNDKQLLQSIYDNLNFKLTAEDKPSYTTDDIEKQIKPYLVNEDISSMKVNEPLHYNSIFPNAVDAHELSPKTYDDEIKECFKNIGNARFNNFKWYLIQYSKKNPNLNDDYVKMLKAMNDGSFKQSEFNTKYSGVEKDITGKGKLHKGSNHVLLLREISHFFAKFDQSC